MITVADWKHRLAMMDHSKGTTNKMIQAAMKAEILALRRALRDQTKRTERAQLRAVQWRAHATRYQQLAASK